jgi:Na+:H+ antiporter, NhaA family
MNTTGTLTAAPPLVERVLGPFQRFVSTSASGGIMLLVATAIALVWANSGWADDYHHLWETPIAVGAPSFGLVLPLHVWVNDGLMAVFFVLVGLEIKRETLVGKPLGISLASLAALRAGVAELPTGVTLRHIHGASWLAGIGFTMSLFIAGLAFGSPAVLDTAKIGILGASVIAGAVGYLLLRTTPKAA